jgi:hypothetical protein
MDQNEVPLDPCHLSVPLGVQYDFVSLWYVRRKPCTYLAPRLTLSPNRPKMALLNPRHQGVPFGVPEMVSTPAVHSA